MSGTGTRYTLEFLFQLMQSDKRCLLNVAFFPTTLVHAANAIKLYTNCYTERM